MSHNHYEDYHGHDHGDHSGHQHIQQIPTLPSQTLYKKIDLSGISGLNFANQQEQLSKVFKNSETKYQIRPILQSDADNQLILKIPFIDNIKLYSIILRTNGDADNCPKKIKLFKNNDKLDFDNISSAKATHQLEHPLVGYIEDHDYSKNDTEIVTVEDESTFVEHHLPRSTFTSVNHLTIFFENNWSDDEDEYLKIYSIEFRGEFTEVNRAPIITTYESAANPADHKNLLKQKNENLS